MAYMDLQYNFNHTYAHARHQKRKEFGGNQSQGAIV